MRKFALCALVLLGVAPTTCAGVEWKGFSRRIGIGSSAGYHVYDACPWMHDRHTALAHSVDGFYYGGHPKYQLNSPNACFYSTQWCQIAPFGPSYAGLHNYMPSAPYRGVYPLTGCCQDVPIWSDVDDPAAYDSAPSAEGVEPGVQDPPPQPRVEPAAVEAKPAKARLNARPGRSSGHHVRTSQTSARSAR